MGALYLGTFFILSHIFEEAKALPEETEKVDWTKHQVSHESVPVSLVTDSHVAVQIESSSNVCGWKLAILNGGLNYQIEHHLFPRMSHVHYWKIAPVVKQCCEEFGVQVMGLSVLCFCFLLKYHHLFFNNALFNRFLFISRIQYVTFPTILSNVISCLRQLKLLGTTYVASKYDKKSQ